MGYWLFTNALASQSEASFGATSLSDEAFPQRLCQLITKSNFVPYGRVTRVLAPGLRFRSAALYEASLHRTFGSAEPTEGLSITAFRPLIEQGRAPYLVQNATIVSPDARALPWPEKVIEFTSLSYGSSEIGYLGWGTRPGTAPLPMRKTTAVSGAAFGPLTQTLPLSHPGTGAPQFKAHDGGKSENLGALALIRRGIPNIIITDAEHDPVYLFDAYRTLQAGLALNALELRVEAIDEHLRNWPADTYREAVARGQVTERATGRLISTIHYIKANIAGDIAAKLDAERMAGSSGSTFQRRYYSALEASADRPGGAWRCDRLAVPAGTFPTSAWAAFNVASYSDWLRGNLKSRVVRAVSRGSGVRSIRIDFPQYSTADQSFYVDQAQAFAGLGYLQTRKLGLSREAGVP